MTPTQIKRVEQRRRRRAARQGLSIRKSRTRCARASDFGCYMVVDVYTNSAEAYWLSLDVLMEWFEVSGSTDA